MIIYCLPNVSSIINLVNDLLIIARVFPVVIDNNIVSGMLLRTTL